MWGKNANKHTSALCTLSFACVSCVWASSSVRVRREREGNVGEGWVERDGGGGCQGSVPRWMGWWEGQREAQRGSDIERSSWGEAEQRQLQRCKRLPWPRRPTHKQVEEYGSNTIYLFGFCPEASPSAHWSTLKNTRDTKTQERLVK